MYGTRRTQDTCTVIPTGDDEVMEERFCWLYCKSATDGEKLTKLIKASIIRSSTYCMQLILARCR